MTQRKKQTILLKIKVAIALLFSAAFLHAQNTGKVLDKETNTPISGVNIYMNNKLIIRSNNKGEFDLRKLYAVDIRDTLSFSYVGYCTKKIPAASIKNTNSTVYLFKDTLSLKEITITSNKKPLEKLLFYTELAPLKIGVSSFGSVIADNKIYVFGGSESTMASIKDEEKSLKSVTKLSYSLNWLSYSNKLQIYNITNDVWQIGNANMRKRAFENANFYNNRIYILGGKNLSSNKMIEYLDNTIELYDMKSNKVYLDTTNPHQGANFASFIYNNSLIVMGGSVKETDESKIYTKKAHMQDLKTGLWYELPNMPTSKETKGVLIDNCIYLIGGFNGGYLDNIERYNIKTGKWTVLGKLPYQIERPAIACKDSIIYIYDGGKVQTLDLKTNEIKVYSIDLSLKNSELLCKDNMLYIIEGIENTPGVSVVSKSLYRIDINDFDKTQTIGEPVILKYKSEDQG